MEEKSMMEAVQSFAAKQVLNYVKHKPERNLHKVLDWADKFDKDGLYQSQRQALCNALDHPDGNWYQLIRRVFQLDEGVRDAFLENFMINASLIGGARQEAVSRGAGVPSTTMPKATWNPACLSTIPT